MVPWERKSYSIRAIPCSVCAYCFLWCLFVHTYSLIYTFDSIFHKMHSALIRALSLCSLFIKRLTLIGYRKSTIHVCYDRFFWQILFFVFVVFDRFYLSLSLCFSSTTLNSLFLCHSLTSSLQVSLSLSSAHLMSVCGNASNSSFAAHKETMKDDAK